MSYEDQAEHADDHHKDLSALTKDQSIEAYERLRCGEAIQSIQIRGAEEEKNNDWETQDSRRGGRTEDPSCGRKTGIFGFLADVPARLKAD